MHWLHGFCDSDLIIDNGFEIIRPHWGLYISWKPRAECLKWKQIKLHKVLRKSSILMWKSNVSIISHPAKLCMLKTTSMAWQYRNFFPKLIVFLKLWHKVTKKTIYRMLWWLVKENHLKYSPLGGTKYLSYVFKFLCCKIFQKYLSSNIKAREDICRFGIHKILLIFKFILQAFNTQFSLFC